MDEIDGNPIQDMLLLVDDNFCKREKIEELLLEERGEEERGRRTKIERKTENIRRKCRGIEIEKK